MPTKSLLATGLDWLNRGEEFVVRTSPVDAEGYWVGAPGVYYDAEEQAVYLYYRLRSPRGSGRGYEARIAKSLDGVTFDDVWHVTQEQLNSPSIERGALTKKQGEWVLYLSYVNGVTHQWQIDRLVGDRVETLNISARQLELDAPMVGGHAVKDPVIMPVGPLSFLYVSYAPATLVDADASSEDLHTSDDVFTTGRVHSHTGLAISAGGDHYHWVGEVLGSSPTGWDSLVSRISGFVKMGSLYLAFYDGAADVHENYEERVGLALTADMKSFYKVPADGPWLQSQYGSLRYVAPVQTAEGLILYYEARTESGAHILCGRKLGGLV